MPFCANCGAEIKDLSQNFCEKCGSPIPESMKSEKVSISKTPSQTSSTLPGGLFDINRKYYILKEKYWDI
ncbi:MAG: zinc-ribbon domain-containing protein [Candidatus Odinarchaeota archaeon]